MAIIDRTKTVAVTKHLAAASAYHAKDVLSESASAGTVWTFDGMARALGSGGQMVKAIASSKTTNVTPRLSLFLFSVASVTCAKNDHAANTCVVDADIADTNPKGYVGRIDFSAMESVNLGTGNSEAMVVPGSFNGLPLSFDCASGDDALYGILATWDAFTQTAADHMTIILTAEQN